MRKNEGIRKCRKYNQKHKRCPYEKLFQAYTIVQNECCQYGFMPSLLILMIVHCDVAKPKQDIFRTYLIIYDRVYAGKGKIQM